MADLIFKITSKEQLKHIQKAEFELSKAGVYFDTDSGMSDSGVVFDRYWHLDQTLVGAVIKGMEE